MREQKACHQLTGGLRVARVAPISVSARSAIFAHITVDLRRDFATWSESGHKLFAAGAMSAVAPRNELSAASLGPGRGIVAGLQVDGRVLYWEVLTSRQP